MRFKKADILNLLEWSDRYVLRTVSRATFRLEIYSQILASLNSPLYKPAPKLRAAEVKIFSSLFVFSRFWNILFPKSRKKDIRSLPSNGGECEG